MVRRINLMSFVSTFILLILIFFSIPFSAHASNGTQIASINSYNLDTNFYSLQVDEFPTPEVESQLVAAHGNAFFLAGRTNRKVSQVYLDPSGITLKQVIDIPQPSQFPPESAKSTFNYVLDLITTSKALFILVANGSWDKSACGQAIVYKYLISDLSSEPQIIFRSSPCLSGSLGWNGRLAVDNNYLYVAGGDLLDNYGYGYFPSESLTNYAKGDKRPKTNFFGAVSKINLNNKKITLVATGLRNLGGLFKDPITRQLYESENGPRGGDEVNLIEQGKNYGWPGSTLGRPYDSSYRAESVIPNSLLNSMAPIFGWTPSISPSTLMRYPKNGYFSKYWADNILVGSLKDESLHRLFLSPDGKKVLYDEKISIGVRIRSFTVTTKGLIVISTDNSKIIILNPGNETLNGTFPKL